MKITKEQLEEETMNMFEIGKCILLSLIIVPISMITHIVYSTYELCYIPNYAVDLITNNIKSLKILKRNHYANI